MEQPESKVPRNFWIILQFNINYGLSLGLGVLWRELSNDSLRLNLEDFQQGIMRHNLNLSISEISELFTIFDQDNSGN